MNLPTTFERVYVALKQWLREGMFRPGERLEPAHLSDRLNASVTPVRDALHRLTGERLVESPPQEGFRMPLRSEVMLRHLYAWHRDLLLLAIAHRETQRWQDLQSKTQSSTTNPLEAELLDGLAAASENPEHAAAFRNLAERLQPYRLFETDVLEELDLEVETIANAVRHSDHKALRRALLRYHRRRDRIVPKLLARMQEQR